MLAVLEQYHADSFHDNSRATETLDLILGDHPELYGAGVVPVPDPPGVRHLSYSVYTSATVIDH